MDTCLYKSCILFDKIKIVEINQQQKEKLMKKLIAGSMAVLLATPALAGGYAYEQQPTSVWGWEILPYMALRGGATYGNLNYNFNNVKEDLGLNMYQIRTALGLTMSDTARFEIEGSFFTKGKKTKDFGDVQNVNVSAKNIELMANTYMNIGHFKYIQPFAGLGAGLAFVDREAIVGGVSSSKNDTKFSAMGALGLDMPFGCFAVDVTARYNYVDVASGMHNFSGDVGVRYMF